MATSNIVWATVRDGLAAGTITVPELDKNFKVIGQSLSPSRLFDSLEEIWNKPNNAGILDYLVSRGTVSSRFGLIRHAIVRFADRREQERKEGHEESSLIFELSPEVLAERILQKDPEVLSELGGKNNGEGKNLLHYAIEFGAGNIIDVILKLFKDNKIGNPEKLLVESRGRQDSPFMALISDNENLGPVQTILRALPALTIDNSVLSMAIELERNDILLAFATIRPDCVTIELLNYCILFEERNHSYQQMGQDAICLLSRSGGYWPIQKKNGGRSALISAASAILVNLLNRS